MAGSVTSFIPFPQMPIADGRGMCTPEWYRYLNQPSFQSADFPDKATSTDGLPEGTTNLYFTDARAQDAVGNILQNTSTITFSYVPGQYIRADFTGSASDVSINQQNYQVVTGSTVQAAIDSIDAELLHNAGTGMHYGMQITINAINTSAVDISAGNGSILDNTNPANPTFTVVNYAGATGIAVANTTAPITYWSIDSTGTVNQSTTAPTPDQYRTSIQLGSTTYNAGQITRVIYDVDSLQQTTAQICDLFDALGTVNYGISPFANGANLNFNMTAGRLSSCGANFYTDPLDPNFISVAAKTLVTFRYGTQSTEGTTDTTVVDVAHYDVGGVITLVPGSTNRATPHTVWQLRDGSVRLQYSQNYYQTIADAIANLSTRSFIPNPVYAAQGTIVGAIVAQIDATDLSNTSQAVFVKANRFGEFIGGSGTISSVISFNGRSGVVVPQSGDYALSQITSLARLWVMA